VQHSTRVDLAVNMTTAEKLGLTFPADLLAAAAEVVE